MVKTLILSPEYITQVQRVSDYYKKENFPVWEEEINL